MNTSRITFEQSEPVVVKYINLRKKVRDYLEMLRRARGIDPDTRMELKRRHIAELEEAVRDGFTLLEVMIALMVLMIGLVCVISIFPVSIIRAVKAHDLTRATDLRYNAEAFIDLYPGTVTDPDNNQNRIEHYGKVSCFDPLGWCLLDQSHRSSFGNVPRYHGSITTVDEADKRCSCQETQVPRQYTYLLTMKGVNVGGAASGARVSCVVFRGRSFSYLDEQAYTAKFTQGDRSVTVDPSLKLVHGHWVMDSDNARWYRITSTQNGNGKITIENPAIESSPQTGGHVIAPDGIIDVFPLGEKLYRP